MEEPNLPHKSSKTSQKHGAYITEFTSPTNAQSNGQAEHFVQTIKNSLTKAMEGGEDPHFSNPHIWYNTLKSQSTITRRVTEL